MPRFDDSWQLSIGLPARDGTGFDARQPLPTEPPAIALFHAGRPVLTATRIGHLDLDRDAAAEAIADLNACPGLRQRLTETETIVRRLAVSNPLLWCGRMRRDPDKQTVEYVLECVHCKATNLEPHRDGCVFWAAVQWADQHPVGEQDG